MSEKEKMNVNTAPAVDTSTGTAEDVEAIMKKYDRESNTRIWEGVPKKVVRYLLAAFALLMVYMNLFANWDERVRRSLFVGIVIILSFLVYPAKKGSTKKNHIPIYDIVLMVLGAGAYFYFVINFKTIIGHATRISQLEVIVGIIGILVLAETCRRVVGIPILCVATVFIGYAFYSGLGAGRAFPQVLKSIVYNLFYTTSGVIGTPIGVCSTYIALFILFGAFLEATGISEFFIQLANSLAGASTGGPAKVAVISSALCGMVSGSSVGNTVTTGSVTIPLMKKTGYKGEFAGAVEAAASTGGQIMPPVMGAGAFILAEMIGISYAEVSVAAIMPALIYFLAVAFQVDFEAGKLGMKGLPEDKLLPRMKTLKEGWLFLIPIAVLIWALCIMGYSANYSSLYAIAVILLIGFLFLPKGKKLNVQKVFEALEGSAKDMLSVAMACSVAGLMIGVLTKTGLGLKFTSILLSVSGGAKLPTMILTMVCCIILGMGLPTTAAFIITSTLCAPALIQLGITPMGAYMFAFYFACLSAITPPVALAAFAAAGLSGAKPMETGFCATRLGLAGFLIPYFFCFTPAMLMQGSPFEIIRVCVTSVIGIYFLSGGLEGFMYRNLNVIERIILIVAALLLVEGGGLTDLIGIIMGGFIVFIQLRYMKKDDKEQAKTEAKNL